MNCDILKFFSQNVQKNKLIIDIILETQFSFDIIFIQEPHGQLFALSQAPITVRENFLLVSSTTPTGLLSPDLL